MPVKAKLAAQILQGTAGRNARRSGISRKQGNCAGIFCVPTPGSVTTELKPPGPDYYRQARKEFARLYKTYNLNPPGAPAG